MTHYAVPISDLDVGRNTQFDGGTPIYPDLDEAPSLNDLDGALFVDDLGGGPDNLFFGLSPACFTVLTAGDYKIVIRAKTNEENSVVLTVTLGSGWATLGNGFVAFDATLLTTGEEGEFQTFEYVLNQGELDLLIGSADPDELWLEIDPSGGAGGPPYYVSALWFEAPGDCDQGGEEDDGQHEDDNHWIIIEPPVVPEDWEPPGQPEEPPEGWDDPPGGSPSSAGPNTYPWQQLSPVQELDDYDFVLRVDDQFPLLVTNHWPSHQIVDDIEEP